MKFAERAGARPSGSRFSQSSAVMVWMLARCRGHSARDKAKVALHLLGTRGLGEGADRLFVPPGILVVTLEMVADFDVRVHAAHGDVVVWSASADHGQAVARDLHPHLAHVGHARFAHR